MQSARQQAPFFVPAGGEVTQQFRQLGGTGRIAVMVWDGRLGRWNFHESNQFMFLWMIQQLGP
jgi:hypothetical protein